MEIIIGLGNTILTDDSVGIKVAKQLYTYFYDSEFVDLKEFYSGGIRLLDVLTGYDRAVIIGAILTKENAPGKIHHLTMNNTDTTWHMVSFHDMNLTSAFTFGALLELPLTSQFDIWGIKGADLHSFGESLSVEVAEAVPKVVNTIIEKISLWLECTQSIGA